MSPFENKSEIVDLSTSSIFKIHVPGFHEVWLKDESVNPTGTHKDRLAKFIVDSCRQKFGDAFPSLSVISSGSTALAIQNLLRVHQLPNLRVLVHQEIRNDVREALERIGCEVYITDLRKKSLSPAEILALTQNPEGLDITSDEEFGCNSNPYNDLSYDLLNQSPEYCFVPFGTGTLYENILNINKKELSSKQHDPRFQGNVDALRNCHFLGATTNNPHSKAAEKLYSHHAPFGHFDEQWIRTYRLSGFCGELSNVYVIQEQYLDEALALAEKQKINCEPSGIAGLALLLQMQKQIPKDKKILVVNTGKAKMD